MVINWYKNGQKIISIMMDSIDSETNWYENGKKKY